mgnify:FL=1
MTVLRYSTGSASASHTSNVPNDQFVTQQFANPGSQGQRSLQRLTAGGVVAFGVIPLSSIIAPSIAAWLPSRGRKLRRLYEPSDSLRVWGYAGRSS